MPAVYLVRHGQASFGAADYDVLSETGRRQAALAGAALAIRKPVRLVAGSLRRQQDSAVALAAPAGLGVPPEVDGRFDEYDHTSMFTKHAGRLGALATGVRAALGNGKAVQAALDAALHEWVTTGSDSSNGMTYTEFRAGAREALEEQFKADCPAVVVTSGGVIAAICADLLGLGADGFVALNRVTVNSGITTVVNGRSGTTLLSFNEHTHVLTAPDLLTYR